MYLLDTNVVSELRRPRPHGAVLEWIANIPADALFLSAVAAVRRMVPRIARLPTSAGTAILENLDGECQPAVSNHPTDAFEGVVSVAR